MSWQIIQKSTHNLKHHLLLLKLLSMRLLLLASSRGHDLAGIDRALIAKLSRTTNQIALLFCRIVHIQVATINHLREAHH